MNWSKRHETIDKNCESFCFLLYELCSSVSVLVTETGQMWKFREMVKSPDWSFLFMRAIRGRLSKGTFVVISGCLIIGTSFEKLSPCTFTSVFWKHHCNIQVTWKHRWAFRWKGTISLMLFCPDGGRFLVRISGAHVYSLCGGLLGGDLEDVQQTFRRGQARGFLLSKHGVFNLFWRRRKTELKKM